ncbi:hypothetical protein [Pengzhenrongella frigida]|uniref:hypothetical protein n=1 Tax=Pengzhenrongella frigida TaxID=1259133 RepID=UPI0013EC9282|nr:hypothetical protein [Cellulomonas sp. HLT2-17]
MSTSVDAMPHAALYIRDALELKPVVDDVSPPPLSHRPPDRLSVLTEEERDQAGAQWPGWWRAILSLEARTHEPSDRRDFAAWLAPMAAERARTVGDPPDFDALTGSPTLKKAVVELFREAHNWSDHTRSPDPGEAYIPWAITRDVAEEVAARHGVSPREVRGVVILLGVEGVWSNVLEPGVVVCSLGCLGDDAIATDLVRTAFETGLYR